MRVDFHLRLKIVQQGQHPYCAAVVVVVEDLHKEELGPLLHDVLDLLVEAVVDNFDVLHPHTFVAGGKAVVDLECSCIQQQLLLLKQLPPALGAADGHAVGGDEPDGGGGLDNYAAVVVVDIDNVNAVDSHHPWMSGSLMLAASCHWMMTYWTTVVDGSEILWEAVARLRMCWRSKMLAAWWRSRRREQELQRLGR